MCGGGVVVGVWAWPGAPGTGATGFAPAVGGLAPGGGGFVSLPVGFVSCCASCTGEAALWARALACHSTTLKSTALPRRICLFKDLPLNRWKRQVATLRLFQRHKGSFLRRKLPQRGRGTLFRLRCIPVNALSFRPSAQHRQAAARKSISGTQKREGLRDPRQQANADLGEDRRQQEYENDAGGRAQDEARAVRHSHCPAAEPRAFGGPPSWNR